MRRPLNKPVSPQGDTIEIKVIRIQDATRLVTLEDPSQSPQDARGAFARLKPPEDTPDHETEAWRQRIASVALAVKVLPTPRAADVPNEATRVGEDEKVGTIREEALALAKQTKNPEVEKLTTKILDDVGVR